MSNSGLFLTRIRSRRRSARICYSFAAVFVSRAEIVLSSRCQLTTFVSTRPKVENKLASSRIIQSAKFVGVPKRNNQSWISPFNPFPAMSSSSAAEFSSSSVVNNEGDEDIGEIGLNYRNVQQRVEIAAASESNQHVRLVAVSKTKPIELLKDVYNAGCRYFGENYVQEMIDKVPLMPNDVQWHFIGSIQSNKCNTLIKSMNGDVNRLTVETISSIKLATKLNTAVEQSINENNSNKDTTRLKVFIQVNTSAEDSKSGVEPGTETIELCQYIVNNCPMLELRGLMTIGAPGDSSCFITLVNCKNHVIESIPELSNNNMELSMGMSGDFEEAISAGATNVRVGSTIFGERDYSK